MFNGHPLYRLSYSPGPTDRGLPVLAGYTNEGVCYRSHPTGSFDTYLHSGHLYVRSSWVCAHAHMLIRSECPHSGHSDSRASRDTLMLASFITLTNQ